jgi:aspartate aminotransferase-like enzyme
MPKPRLMTPGPTQVPERARLAIARQVIHHRTPEFKALFAEVLDGLRYVFQTRSDVVVLSASGTGAMEAAVVNLVPRGGKAIVLDAGVFARRWAQIARVFGIQVVQHEVPWGQAVDPADVARLLQQHPDAVAVFGTLMESSTGVGHDVQAIARVVRETQAAFVVDAISGAGAMECRTDDWGVDVLVVGAQKALMLPPGLSFLSVSEKAWRQVERIEPQAFYFNLPFHRKSLQSGGDTPWTPAVTLLVGLAENLRQIRAAGIEATWAQCERLARATRAGVKALGLELFAARPAAGLTAAKVPGGVDGAALLKRLESRFGVKLAGGQDKLKGQIIRIGHFGALDELDVLGTLAALELVLAEMGQPVKLGTAVAAASAELLERSSGA